MDLLIVEDEFLIARLLKTCLEQQGHVVTGMAARLDDAQRLLASVSYDAVILDVNLAGQSSEPVAATLAQKGIPFLVVSGYSTEQLKGELLKAPFMAKPLNLVEFVTAVAGLAKPRA